MRKKLIFVLAFVLVFTLLTMPVNAAKPPAPDPRVVDTVSTTVTDADHEAATLMAGQDMPVGKVYINACEEPN